MSNIHTIVRRPLSDKVGTCIWPYQGTTEKQIAGAAEMGMKYVSAGAEIEGSGNWANSDLIIDAYNQAVSQGLYFMTGSANGATSGKSPTASDLFGFKEAFSKIFNYFKGKGVIYNGWNEPNGVFWTTNNQPTAQTNYETVKASTDMEIWLAKQARNIDSTATITGPSMIYPPDDTPENRIYVNMIAEMGLFKYLDAVCEHPYMRKPTDNGCPEQLIETDNFKVTNLPKVSNEFGFPWNQKKVSNDAGFQGIWNLYESIKLTLRQILIMDYMNYSIIALYTAECGTNDYSLLDIDGNLTAVGKSIKWLISELDGYTLDSKIEITEHVGYIDDLYLMKYTKEGANDKLVYWTPSRMGELYGLIYQNNFYKLKFSDYPQILEVN
ncbi:MAG: hypothetical protein LKJ22_08660 [Liquorilactobacillus nagelii]|jgi:hypothetical protein|uniref:hypothetical protein n=1 Tax=Liquorilactobacillus nagelii TaxID=82688 RepID=UPI0024327C90|nr:hypothetical protein [Liquorilactobacillus nagelii]MCI1921978.1 hypothetical protein [Liquorilactobacillus nagelii]MCI1976374.1 hypothetical protein [Liquorilactobacillus nagelii]